MPESDIWNAAWSSPWVLGLLFTLGAAMVWSSGQALAARVNLIAERTGLGRVFAGAVLLGLATSLPELATTVSAASRGAAELAGNNLLGGVAMQMAVLALVDATALRGRALTLFSPRSSLLLHGVFLVVLLALASAAIIGPDLALAGLVSPWSLLLAGAYAAMLFVLKRYEQDPRWEPRGELQEPPESARDMKDAMLDRFEGVSLRRIVVQFAACAVLVLVGGWTVAATGDALAERTGLGETLVGATLVALATSLPEVSTTFGAVRFGAYSMAVANILGTNAVEVALFLPADLVHVGGSIFATLDEASVLMALLGMVMTLTYLWGVLERRNRTVLGCGLDSFVVLVVYACGMAIFTTMA